MKNDIPKIILAFLVTAFVVYLFPRLGVPRIALQVVFILLIVYVFNSKDNIFWLAWFYAINNAPGRLFVAASQSVYRIPSYPLMRGVVITFGELFLIMFIVKTLMKREPARFMFKREIWLYIGLGLFYFAISFFIGISEANIIRSVRMLLPWFWIYVFYHTLKDEQNLKRFFLMLVPFALMALVAVIQTYITGSYLGDMLGQHSGRWQFDATEENLARVYSSASLNVLTMILALYYLVKKQSGIKQNLVILVVLVSFLNIYLSATRGWMLSIMILLSSLLFISGMGFYKQLLRIAVIAGLMYVSLTFVYSGITSQVQLSYQRFLTLEALVEGDVTAGGTLSRIDVRSPLVMNAWRESPVIGWGFSDTFHAYADNHVANQTNLLNFGILGFIVIHLIYLSFIYKTFIMGRKNVLGAVKRKEALVFLFALLAIFFAHSTSGGMWGHFTRNGFFWGIFLSALNAELNSQPQLPVPSAVTEEGRA